MIRFEIITCSADVNEEDPRALVTEYLLKDNYSSIMFKGSNSNDNKPKNTEYRSNTKRSVWSSSDSGVMNKKNAVSPSPSPIAEREITEEISDPDDEEIVVDKKNKKHKKNKHKKADHKESKEKKKENKKEKKERKRGWE